MNYIDYSDWFGLNGFHAFFSQKQEDYSSVEKRKKFAASLSFDHDSLVIPKQVHSNKVQLVNVPGILKDTDGLISNQKGIVLSIQVADCIPLFLVDNKTGNFGLIHSGWRGTAAGIGTRAIHQLKIAGSHAKDILGLIGSAINQCCFEVGPEVSDQFDPSFSIGGKGDRRMLDLKNALKHQLTESGMAPENIMIDGDCTYCRKELYFSYRREGDKYGKMVAIAGWR
ncbi:peptidoglycan editing factor PgeF [Caldithrix abyssi]|nr:peptidoglycan editing factor PgeF [Caldithrix abyssi]